jgi:hypothetical protein
VLAPLPPWHPPPLGGDVRAATIERAERAASEPIPALPATLFLEFARTGAGDPYFQAYSARRRILRDLVVGETAGALAWTMRLVGDALQQAAPSVTRRISSEVRRRVLDPCATRDFWWIRRTTTSRSSPEPSRPPAGSTPPSCWVAPTVPTARSSPSISAVLIPTRRESNTGGEASASSEAEVSS